MGNQCCRFTVISKLVTQNTTTSTNHVVTAEEFKTADSSHFTLPTSAGIQIVIDFPPVIRTVTREYLC